MNVFGKAERWLDSRTPLNWVLYYLFVSFALFLVADWVGFSSAQYLEGSFVKELGLWWSVNWTVTFLILYPLFCYLATSGATGIRQFWLDAGDSKLVTGENGAAKTGAALHAEWVGWLGKSNKVAYAFILICILIGVTDFRATALKPLLACKLAFPDTNKKDLAAPIDWTTIPIVTDTAGSCLQDRVWLLLEAGALYTLLAVSLMFFLNYLYYSGIVFGFLAKVARRSGETRLVLRVPELSARLAPVIENLMMCVVLGLSVCALMRGHYAYLQSPAHDAVEFLTSDIHRLLPASIESFLGATAADDPAAASAPLYFKYQSLRVAKGVVVWPLAATVILIGIVGLLQLYAAIQNAWTYFDRKSKEDPEWSGKVGLSAKETNALKAMAPFQVFLTVVSPYLYVYVIACGLLILSIIKSSMLIFLVSAVFVFAYRGIFSALVAKRKEESAAAKA
jgi:hypothetical protein